MLQSYEVDLENTDSTYNIGQGRNAGLCTIKPSISRADCLLDVAIGTPKTPNDLRILTGQRAISKRFYCSMAHGVKVV